MRYQNTLYVRNHRARISHRRGALVVSSPDESQRVPIEAIDAVVLLGGAQVTTQAIDACVERGVRLAALKMSGAVRFIVSPPTGGNINLRVSQFEHLKDEQLSLEIAKNIVAAKIQNSFFVVSRWARDEPDTRISEKLTERASLVKERVALLADASTGDQVRGVEGDAARIYFRAVKQVVSTTEFEFASRTRRPPRDPVNAVLSFCYSMLVTECTGATQSVGLDFQMGYLHRPRSGRPSLALDLAEEFRALTDRFVVTLLRRRQLTPDHFTTTPGGGVYLNDDGRVRLLKLWEEHKETEYYHALLERRVERWALPSIQATLLARKLRGDLSAYPAFVLT